MKNFDHVKVKIELPDDESQKAEKNNNIKR